VYEYLEGVVRERSGTRLVLDVAGVGYDLYCPLGSSFPERGPAVAWTHLVVRADAHELYGFAERETRELFRALLTVSGVGPRMALGVLSGLPREELLAAVIDEDMARLTAIRGVGKKTAQQILLDLADKARALASSPAPAARPGEIPRPAGGPPDKRARLEDAVRALTSIGYSEKEARRQVERAAGSVGAGDLEQLVRSAIAGA
jgi:Holliday junction DNA helicase RuvA